MNRRSKATLCGAIRLVKTPHSIGIPLFKCRDLNHGLVPEMDAEFRITRFWDFLNADDYPVVEEVPGFVYDLYGGNQPLEFSIGDAAPLPFWYNGQYLAILADADPEEFGSLFSVKYPGLDVIEDLTDLLDGVRHGRFRQQLDSWRADNIRALFSDIFFDPPSHSRFWVSRFRVAVTNVRSKTQPSKAIDKSLRETAEEWLGKFGSKTDYARLRMMLGDIKGGLFDSYDVTATVFAYLTHKLARGAHHEVSKIAANDSEFLQFFPDGLHFYFIEHDHPYAYFDYEKLSDYLQPLRDLVLKGLQTYMLKDARRLSVALFGQRDAPAKFAEFIAGPRSRLFDDFHSTMDREIYSEGYERRIITHVRSDDDEYILSLQKAIRQYDALRDLEGMEFADSRLVTKPKDFMGIRQETIDDLRMSYKGRER